MATKTYCDICTKEIEDGSSQGGYVANFDLEAPERSVRILLNIHIQNASRVDVCKECTLKILRELIADGSEHKCTTHSSSFYDMARPLS